VNYSVGSIEIHGEVAEQIDRQGFGRQQISPEASLIEVEIDVAADQAWLRFRSHAMGADRVAVVLPPHRMVEAHPAAELGQLRVATNPVVVQPAVFVLELRS
jgi:hypothetical protein